MTAYNSFATPTEPPRELLTAHIAVIPKPDKDPSLVSNYRPISLLNVDLKWYAKTLAIRLLPFIPQLIDLDQVGFIPGRESRDNTLKAINIHHWLTSTQTRGFMLSLDAEKAFDRLAWDFMTETLKAIGLPSTMLNFILALYSNPTARVRVNGHLSDAFSVSHGTRQGCPLSPLIFILSLEPLLNRLRANPDIKSIDIKHRTFKLAAFADDILLFLTEPLTTIPNLLKDFQTFNTLTNLQINFSKSTALNVSLDHDTCHQCQNNFPFKWNNRAITYLGIQLPTSLNDLYSLNHATLLQKIILDLKKWSTGLFSWFGRIAIIKMNILPSILYILQTIPIKLPQTFSSTYKKVCTNFIWGTKRPRLDFARLTTPKLLGGLGLTDICKYQQACHLARIVDWNIHIKNKDWIHLEQSFSDIPIAQLPWTEPRYIPALSKNHPLINPTLATFHTACKKYKISSLHGPMTPLRLNPDFTPGMHTSFLVDHWPYPTVRAEHFFNDAHLLTQSALATKLNIDTFPFWTYVQLRHFFNKPKPRPDWSRCTTKFEHLCLSENAQNHLISQIYTLLFITHTPKKHWTIQKWERDLSVESTDLDWDTIYTIIHKGSLNVQIQENAFKIFSRWYRTPNVLHQIDPTIS